MPSEPVFLTSRAGALKLFYLMGNGATVLTQINGEARQFHVKRVSIARLSRPKSVTRGSTRVCGV